MPGTPFRHLLRESRNLIIICAIVFAGLLAARMYIGKRYDNKGYLERAYKEDVAGLRARGLNKEADALRRDKTLTEQEARIQERKAKGDTVAPEAYVPVWLYKGLHLNLAIAGVLLLLSPLLGRKRSAEMKFLQGLPPPPFPKWQIAACAAVMAFAAWQNAPRLFHSMWGDEEFNASRFILDYAERNDAGTLEIKERSWVTTLWNMRKPTNHLGYSFFARLTHDTFFQKSKGATDPWFSEALLRTPVFVAGLLLIPAFLWALRVWGLQPWWGLPFLVLHPWFTRFGVDGRGYGFVMLGAAVMLGVLGRALQTGRWRWWVPFGLLGFFLVWSNLQGIYPVVALNLTAFVCLLRRDLAWPARSLLASRWFVANMLTLMLIVGYLAPCLPQFQEFMARREIGGDLDWRFWKDGLCAWAFGQPFHPWDDPQNPLLYAMEISMQTLPALHVVGIALFGVLVIAGIIDLARKAEHRALLAFTLGAPAIMLLHMTVTNNRPYDWYFTPFLPGLFLMVAAGAMFFTSRFSRKLASVSLLVLTLALYAFVTRQPRTLLREHPIEPSRDSVALYRKITNPRHPDIDKDVMSGAIAMYSEGYDPALHRVDDVPALQALMAEADRTNRKLYMNVGYFKFLRDPVHAPNTAPMCKIMEDPAQFEHVATLPGLLPYTTRDVFRYKGKAS